MDSQPELFSAFLETVFSRDEGVFFVTTLTMPPSANITMSTTKTFTFNDPPLINLHARPSTSSPMFSLEKTILPFSQFNSPQSPLMPDIVFVSYTGPLFIARDNQQSSNIFGNDSIFEYSIPKRAFRDSQAQNYLDTHWLTTRRWKGVIRWRCGSIFMGTHVPLIVQSGQ